MASLTFLLPSGITVGDVTHTECVVREATRKELKAAARSAEVVVLAPTGKYGPHGEIFEPAVMINPYVMELNTLCLQIERIGDIKGPIEDVYLDVLTESDIAVIKAHVELLTQASLAPGEVVQRGRTDAHRSDDGGAD